jgi:ABC-2 type transport system ATP-binding protein
MTLSFGTRIKLALVLALSWRPTVLILDEPTVGLDAISKQAVFSELLAAVREGERTVLISSHGLADIERFADHLGMIRNGRLLFEGSTTDVIARFRVVDFVVANGDRLADRPGIFVQRRNGTRWRALIDLERTPLETLHGLGATPIADAPVTLEEVFVTVGKA